MKQLLRFQVAGSTAVLWALLFVLPRLDLRRVGSLKMEDLIAPVVGAVALALPLGTILHQVSITLLSPYRKYRLFGRRHVLERLSGLSALVGVQSRDPEASAVLALAMATKDSAPRRRGARHGGRCRIREGRDQQPVHLLLCEGGQWVAGTAAWLRPCRCSASLRPGGRPDGSPGPSPRRGLADASCGRRSRRPLACLPAGALQGDRRSRDAGRFESEGQGRAKRDIAPLPSCWRPAIVGVALELPCGPYGGTSIPFRTPRPPRRHVSRGVRRGCHRHDGRHRHRARVAAGLGRLSGRACRDSEAQAVSRGLSHLS